MLTSAGGISGLHTIGVCPSSLVIGRPGRKSGRGAAWVRVVILTTPPPLPPYLSGCCRLAVTATKGHSSRPVALSTQQVLSVQGPVAKPGAPGPSFSAPATPLLVRPQLPVYFLPGPSPASHKPWWYHPASLMTQPTPANY